MAKKSARKSAARNRKNKKGARYSCRLCGVAVTVDNVCGCVDACDIVCCGEQMIAKN